MINHKYKFGDVLFCPKNNRIIFVLSIDFQRNYIVYSLHSNTIYDLYYHWVNEEYYKLHD